MTSLDLLMGLQQEGKNNLLFGSRGYWNVGGSFSFVTSRKMDRILEEIKETVGCSL